MNVIEQNNINKQDWKKFKNWSNKEIMMFGDINFYSGFFSINNKKIEKSLIDFYLYNHFVLKDRYDFNWPSFLLNIKETSIDKFISQLFLYFFQKEYKYFEPLQEILKQVHKYKINDEKNYDKEFILLEKYWHFIKSLRNQQYSNYNEWIIYINKRIYKRRKGFK